MAEIFYRFSFYYDLQDFFQVFFGTYQWNHKYNRILYPCYKCCFHWQCCRQKCNKNAVVSSSYSSIIIHGKFSFVESNRSLLDHYLWHLGNGGEKCIQQCSDGYAFGLKGFCCQGLLMILIVFCFHVLTVKIRRKQECKRCGGNDSHLKREQNWKIGEKTNHSMELLERPGHVQGCWFLCDTEVKEHLFLGQPYNSRCYCAFAPRCIESKWQSWQKDLWFQVVMYFIAHISFQEEKKMRSSMGHQSSLTLLVILSPCIRRTEGDILHPYLMCCETPPTWRGYHTELQVPRSIKDNKRSFCIKTLFLNISFRF